MMEKKKKVCKTFDESLASGGALNTLKKKVAVISKNQIAPAPKEEKRKRMKSVEMDGVFMYEVKSTNVSKIGYDANDKLLLVIFKSGKAYQYVDVPAEVFEKLKSSDSVGRYISMNIKRTYENKEYKFKEKDNASTKEIKKEESSDTGKSGPYG